MNEYRKVIVFTRDGQQIRFENVENTGMIDDADILHINQIQPPRLVIFNSRYWTKFVIER